VSPDSRLPRVAILGGGAGAISTALWLSRPGWQERFDRITVYQLGWRLGGKGASGRGAHDRIEEHGLHIWLGFYDNAFRTLAACYDELARANDVPLATLADAFEPANVFVALEELPDGWVPWIADFPMNDLRPWDPGPRELPTMWEYLERSLELAREFVLSTIFVPSPADSPGLHLAPDPPRRTQAPAGIRVGAAKMSTIERVRGVGLSLVNAWREATRIGEVAIDDLLTIGLEILAGFGRDPSLLPGADHDPVIELLDRALEVIHQRVEKTAAMSDPARRIWYLVDVLVACARGVLRDGLLTHPDGFDAVDDFDFVDWLTRHGCSRESAECTLIRTVVYDMAFAYADGDPELPSCSAASALRGLARMFFTYRGSIAWKMRAGMGDAVFAPMYQCLRARGVTFEFFNRVDALHLSADGRSVESIDIGIQALLQDGHSEYDPLIDVNGLPCWPASPNSDQLANVPCDVNPEEFESFWSGRADAGRVTLREGEDFDVVVLGIAIGSLPYICGELIEEDPRWRLMVDEVKTVYTQAFQLWLGENLSDLGCDWRQATVGGYLEPFDTYADMSQLIQQENWAGAVKGIAYFCNTMPTPSRLPDRTDTALPARAREDVKRNALSFLDHSLIHLWPLAVDRYPTEFRWQLLAGAQGTSGRARFDSQFWRANVDPSERYVLSLPGTARFRLAPGDSGFDNLYLAGDWTRCGLNAGCVEAAVTSGMLASNAICGVPEMRYIIGCDQP
jgi:uncharacterized protein with NAD-binding domain and iron-sulfur cluster